MLSLKGPWNISGKSVTTSNCIDLQKPFRGVNLDDAGVRVNPPADRFGKRDQEFSFAFSTNPKDIGTPGPKDLLHPSQGPGPRRDDFETHQPENIISAFGKVNQILAVEQDIRAHQRGGFSGRRDALKSKNDPIPIEFRGPKRKLALCPPAPEEERPTGAEGSDTC